MKNLFIILLICICANVQGQTLVNFTTTQQTQLRNFVAAELKKATDPLNTRIATLEAQVKSLSATNAALDTRLKAVEKPNRFDTSFATVTPGATFNTITGNNWKHNDLLSKYNALLSSVQSQAGRLTPLEDAVKKIPTKASSVSTSTTTTTTNTTLQ